jgi:23S rRNA (cytidine2498-2'-O)-methyltransferase
LRALLLHCRPGFEPECAAEIAERAAQAHPGYARTTRGQAFVEWFCEDPSALAAALPWRRLIFARQRLEVLADLADLPQGDRLSPILASLPEHPRGYSEVLAEPPDSEAGKALATLCRKLGHAAAAALRRAGRIDPAGPRLHLFLPEGGRVLVAAGDAGSAPWPQGIPRLRLARQAPSRSALKLEEALNVLLEPQERQAWLKPGMRAVDLGAAPGGWSWVLARQGLHVIAVDNGPMADEAMATGLIEHRREDGFRYRPPQNADWLVCDMVERPRRVARLMADWLREGLARRALFNLKLPMKQRWPETRLCLDLIRAHAGPALDLRARQLYHDREEVTVLALPHHTLGPGTARGQEPAVRA